MSNSSLPLSQFLIFSFCILLLLVANTQTISASKSSTKTYKNFIKTACNTTRYPKDCNKALSPFASAIKTNAEKLCYTALSLALNATRHTSSSIESLSKINGSSSSETAIIRDCVETVGDAIDELRDSLQAMTRLKGSDREFQMSNIRTWVSAALSDDYTCMDDFQDRKVSKAVKNTINKSVMRLAKMTSNSLALFNLFYP